METYLPTWIRWTKIQEHGWENLFPHSYETCGNWQVNQPQVFMTIKVFVSLLLLCSILFHLEGKENTQPFRDHLSYICPSHGLSPKEQCLWAGSVGSWENTQDKRQRAHKGRLLAEKEIIAIMWEFIHLLCI